MSNQETQKTQEQVQKPQESPRITKIETAHVKNPKRVAAGKKLAAYSKAAREQKKAHQQAQRDAEQPITDADESESEIPQQGFDTMTLLTGVGVIVGIAGLYFTYRASRGEQSEQQTHQAPQGKQSESKTVQKELKPTPAFESCVVYSSFNTPKSKLRSFD